MISDARGGHVSPGVYTEEKDVTYSVKSLGITSLGLAGETLYGPAFEPVSIESWSEFVDYFGGTSPEKFRGTGLPKYELPYVAKSYLEESKRLTVVRVLGLSGYHAGPCWVIKSDNKPVVILRSKMSYSDNISDRCAATDKATSIVEYVTVGPYKKPVYSTSCEKISDGYTIDESENDKFSLIVSLGDSQKEYNVSLNPSDSDYIYNVLSSRPDKGTTPIYVEAVFENSITDNGVTNQKLEANYELDDYTEMYRPGVTPWIVSDASVTINPTSDKTIDYFEATLVKKCVPTPSSDDSEEKTEYVYSLKYIEKPTDEQKSEAEANEDFRDKITSIYQKEVTIDKQLFEGDSAKSYVKRTRNEYNSGEVTAILRKLFRFITISDGDASNYQVKVSIQNIKPEDGTFDVVVRDFNDTDASPLILEKFSKCNLVEGDANYVAYKIGTSDGGYVSKSKYIVVEMADGEDFSKSVPAGFLGFPMPDYGTEVPEVSYNTLFNSNVKTKKQYFGMSDITGIDNDILSYKGKNTSKTTKGFHLDAVLAKSGTTIYVDGASGYNFNTVSAEQVGSEKNIPRLINAPAYLSDTIYADVNARKFTVCFYGGFDGWDVNRDERTNGDKYKATKYTVKDSSVFPKLNENGLNASLNLPSTAITSDYYAYLAGYRAFANPQDIDINLFATPGINWRDNALLTEEALDVIEDTEDGRGGDALYVMASPNDELPAELAQDFEDMEFNSSYACTYAPWVMFYDSSNKRYLELPVTKDVVRDMAATDNTSFPWFAPAGTSRGDVRCVKAVRKTTLADEDALYEVGINPVKSFAQDGVKIWGNKTAYSVDSPLNRINVRRLMLRVKKLVTDASKSLLFEQYDTTLEKQFRGLVDPILSEVKSNRGISDYRIVTESTAETRDQHILPAKIMIKPIGALEYISLSFVVYPESVDFQE